MCITNIFQDTAHITFDAEIVSTLLKSNNIRIERILSQGQVSPQTDWYDQNENEWVLVLRGEGHILFEDNKKQILRQGDFMHIPKHKKHKVSYTVPNQITIWLCIFYA